MTLAHETGEFQDKPEDYSNFDSLEIKAKRSPESFNDTVVSLPLKFTVLKHNIFCRTYFAVFTLLKKFPNTLLVKYKGFAVFVRYHHNVYTKMTFCMLEV